MQSAFFRPAEWGTGLAPGSLHVLVDHDLMVLLPTPDPRDLARSAAERVVLARVMQLASEATRVGVALAVLLLAASCLRRTDTDESEGPPGAECIRSADGGIGDPECPAGWQVDCSSDPDKPDAICIFNQGAATGTPRCVGGLGEYWLPPHVRPTCVAR
jgi:hypothetical protein